MSRSRRGRPGKPIHQLHPETKEVIASFPSIKHAADANSIYRPEVRAIIESGKPKRGLLFVFAPVNE